MGSVRVSFSAYSLWTPVGQAARKYLYDGVFPWCRRRSGKGRLVLTHDCISRESHCGGSKALGGGGTWKRHRPNCRRLGRSTWRIPPNLRLRCCKKDMLLMVVIWGHAPNAIMDFRPTWAVQYLLTNVLVIVDSLSRWQRRSSRRWRCPGWTSARKHTTKMRSNSPGGKRNTGHWSCWGQLWGSYLKFARIHVLLSMTCAGYSVVAPYRIADFLPIDLQFAEA